MSDEKQPPVSPRRALAPPGLPRPGGAPCPHPAGAPSTQPVLPADGFASCPLAGLDSAAARCGLGIDSLPARSGRVS